MPRPRKSEPITAMLGAGIGAVAGGPVGAGIGGLIGAALGSSTPSLEQALADYLAGAGFEFSNLRWLDRRTAEVAFCNSQRVFQITRVAASGSESDSDQIADAMFDDFVRKFQNRTQLRNG